MNIPALLVKILSLCTETFFIRHLQLSVPWKSLRELFLSSFILWSKWYAELAILYSISFILVITFHEKKKTFSTVVKPLSKSIYYKVIDLFCSDSSLTINVNKSESIYCVVVWALIDEFYSHWLYIVFEVAKKWKYLMDFNIF